MALLPFHALWPSEGYILRLDVGRGHPGQIDRQGNSMSLLYDIFRWGYCQYKSRTQWRAETRAQSRFSTDVFCILRGAGWFPGRSIPVPESIQWHQPAAAIAAEFGDLTFVGPWGEDRIGPDVRCTSVSIEPLPYFNEEMRGLGLCDIGCIGSVAPMFVDLGGVMYELLESYSKKPRLRSVGYNIDQSLECLLLGITPRGADVSDHKQIEITWGSWDDNQNTASSNL